MDKWDRGAVLLNSYRVVPRVIIAVYFTFFIHAWMLVVRWFMAFDWQSLPADQIVGATAAAAIAGFPAIILGVLTKILRELIHGYWNGSSTQGDGH